MKLIGSWFMMFAVELKQSGKFCRRTMSNQTLESLIQINLLLSVNVGTSERQSRRVSLRFPTSVCCSMLWQPKIIISWILRRFRYQLLFSCVTRNVRRRKPQTLSSRLKLFCKASGISLFSRAVQIINDCAFQDCYRHLNGWLSGVMKRAVVDTSNIPL